MYPNFQFFLIINFSPFYGLKPLEFIVLSINFGKLLMEYLKDMKPCIILFEWGINDYHGKNMWFVQMRCYAQR